MLIRATILFACFVTGAAVIARASRAEPTPIRHSLATFPMTLGEWRGGADQPFDTRTLAVLGVDDYLSRTYVRPIARVAGVESSRFAVGLYIGYYRTQRQGDTIHSPLNCLPGSGWEPVSRSTLEARVARRPGGPIEPVHVNRFVVEKGLERDLVLYWYQSHGRVVASEYASKFFLVRDAVLLNRSDGALVRVIAPIASSGGSEGGSDDFAERQGRAFMQAVFPWLADFLPE